MSQPAIIRFLLGDNDVAVLDELRARTLRWTAQRDDKPIGLQRYHGITPRVARLLMRDALLIEASELLTGTRWSRCQQLAKLAPEFNGRRYDSWSKRGIPERASDVDLLLFRARDVGELLPESPETFLSILPKPA